MAKAPQTARNTMMDYLARRVHTEKELRQKLSQKFEEGEVDQAIEFAKQKSWLAPNEQAEAELSASVAESLHRKGKGILFINEYLEQKGLPPIPEDESLEKEKALELLKAKLKNADADHAKLGRFLVSRGFSMDVVRKVLNEES